MSESNIVVPTEPVKEWSRYQKDIFNFVESEEGSAVVIAVAGSGKSTTIVECANRIPSDKQVAFVAFNKSIADELKRRVPAHVKAQTLNGMGFGSLTRHLGARNLRVDSNKTRGIIGESMTRDAVRLYGSGVQKLVGLAKAHGIVPRNCDGMALKLDTEQNWVDLMEHYDVEFEKEAKPLEGIELARQVLRESIDCSKRIVDFDDQLYLPVIWQARFIQYDVIFVDEAQDVNPIQRAMLKMALKPGGRLVAVGDPCQAIYGFRGADTEAIESIKHEFNARELPLSVSYRCPKNVVKEAKAYVPYIEPSDTAQDGKVETLNVLHPEIFQQTDGIVCRNTAPLIDLAYKLLRRGVAVRVLGREIGQGLVTLIKKMDAETIDQLDEKIHSYADREIQKLMAKGKEDRAAAIQDRVDTIRIFIEQLPETDRTIERLLRNIADLFTDNGHGRLSLCTIHRAKGLEFPRCFILNRYLMPSKYARQDWQKAQENNVIYVAITRAQRELYYIDLNNWTDQKPLAKNAETDNDCASPGKEKAIE